MKSARSPEKHKISDLKGQKRNAQKHDVKASSNAASKKIKAAEKVELSPEPHAESEPGVEWLQLMPSGIMILPGDARPVVLLKHDASGETLPVWVHPLDASVGLHELSQGASGSPHVVVRAILERCDAQSLTCYFIEKIGHHQYVNLEFKKNDDVLFGGPIRVRADEVMSFCIANKARFYSTKSFIAQCRVINDEMVKLQEGLLAGTLGEAFPELEIDSKKTGYVM